MRDIGILVWVAFLIVGVIGSIVSSIRKQAARSTRDGSRRVILSEAVRPSRRAEWQPPPGQLPQWVARIAAQVAPPPAPPRPAPPPPKPSPAPVPAVEAAHEPVAPRRRRLFRDRKAIVQAVIAAEVLGKPRALRDEYL